MNQPSTIFDDFILVRLLLPGKTGLTLKRIQDDLEPFFRHKYTAPEWNTLMEGCWNELIHQGLIEVDRSKKSEKAFLSDEGKQKAHQFIGVHSLPENVTWSTLVNQFLVAKALNVDVSQSEQRKKVSTAGGLRGAILKQAYDLKTSPTPTETQALDALLWKQLGVETNRKFSLTSVKEHLLNQLLGIDPPVEFKKVKPLVAAKAINARRNDPQELKRSVIRGFIDNQKNIPATETIQKSDSNEPFAKEVIQAAQQTQTGWFGTNKVFISHVFSTYRQLYPHSSETLESFKSDLIAAHQQGKIILSRADLIEAMNPQDVVESETTYLNASFHFIRLPGEQP